MDNKGNKRDKTDYEARAYRILSIIRDESDKYPWDQREDRTRFVAKVMIKELQKGNEIYRKEAIALQNLCNVLFPDYMKDNPSS